MSVKQVSDSEFNSLVINSKATAVVHFWATWSSASRIIMPTLEDCSNSYSKVAFYNLDAGANTVTPQSYGVSAVPTLLFFKDGKVSNRHVGVVTTQKLRSMVDGL